MTVAELIEELKKYKPETEVFCSNCCEVDINRKHINDIVNCSAADTPNGHILIEYKP